MDLKNQLLPRTKRFFKNTSQQKDIFKLLVFLKKYAILFSAILLTYLSLVFASIFVRALACVCLLFYLYLVAHLLSFMLAIILTREIYKFNPSKATILTWLCLGAECLRSNKPCGKYRGCTCCCHVQAPLCVQTSPPDPHPLTKQCLCSQVPVDLLRSPHRHMGFS